MSRPLSKSVRAQASTAAATQSPFCRCRRLRRPIAMKQLYTKVFRFIKFFVVLLQRAATLPAVLSILPLTDSKFAPVLPHAAPARTISVLICDLTRISAGARSFGGQITCICPVPSHRKREKRLARVAETR